MIQANGYQRIPGAEAKTNELIQDLLDFGVATMLGHLQEDGLIKDYRSYELFEDYMAFKLITGDKTYYKFQLEVTNNIKMIKATVLIMNYTGTRQEFLEDYRYEINRFRKNRT